MLIDPFRLTGNHAEQSVEKVGWPQVPCKVKHASKRVVRRYAVRQFEELFEPFLMSFAKAFDVGLGVHLADCGRKARAPPYQ